MSLMTHEKDKREAVPTEELKEIVRKLQEQEGKFEEKVKAQNEKKKKTEEKVIIECQKFLQQKANYQRIQAEYKRVEAEYKRAEAVAENAICPAYFPNLFHIRTISKCEKKKARYQKKIDKLKNDGFCLDLQIRLQEARTKEEEKPAYDDDDDSTINENSLEKDMIMSSDELKETIHKNIKSIEYMQLKNPLATFQHNLKKRLNNLYKLFPSEG
ncbi:hypothetical protein ACLB2K_071414 [Fragaria x ananassa]